MKKIFTLMGLVASASILFTNCSRNLDVPSTDGKSFSIIALTGDESRTSNDGLATKWTALDSISLFHAEEGTTTYGTNDKFTIAEEDLAAGKFYGTLTEELTASTNYDWYALYPYSKYYSTPASTSDCYFNIGSKSAGSAQIQNGNDSKAHLCGQYFPLCGKATNVASDATPALTMKQILSAINVKVTNNSGEPLEIKNIAFTATEVIVGSYYLNIAGEDVVFTPSGDKYVSNTAKLNVLDGAAIANGASASFYIGIKPFTAKSSETLSIEVNGYKKELSLTSAVTFNAGEIKTLNFNYDKTPVVEPTTKDGYYRVEDASWLKAGDIVAIASTSENFAMSTTDNGNFRGIIAATQSTDGDYKTLALSSDVQLFTLAEGTKTGTFSFCCVNGTTANKYIAASSSTSNYMASVSDKTDDASFTVSITSGIATVEANGTNTRNSLRYNSGSTRFSCYANNSSMAPVAIFKKYGNPGKLPCSTPVADPKAGEVTIGTTVTLSCTTTGATIYYTTDGTTPTTSSTVYSSAITVNEAVTIKAIATAEGYDQSEVASFAYTVKAAGGTTYTKVTTAPTDWSGEYVIASIVKENKALAWTGVDAGQCHTDTLSVLNNTITESGLITVTVAKTTGGYSIKVNGGINNGKYISESESSTITYANKLFFNTTALAPVQIQLNAAGLVEIYQTVTADNTKKVYFLYNQNSGTSNERFRFYKDSNIGNYLVPALFKK